MDEFECSLVLLSSAEQNQMNTNRSWGAKGLPLSPAVKADVDVDCIIKSSSLSDFGHFPIWQGTFSIRSCLPSSVQSSTPTVIWYSSLTSHCKCFPLCLLYEKAWITISSLCFRLQCSSSPHRHYSYSITSQLNKHFTQSASVPSVPFHSSFA